MQDFIFSVNIILPLFLLIMVGYLLSRFKLLSEEFLRVANKIAFSVFLPVMLFHNISQADFISVFDWRLVLFCVAGILVVFLAAAFAVPLFVKDRTRIPVVIQGIFRSNFILFGVPICESIYGAEGAAVASMTAAFVVPTLNVLAVVILSAYNPERKKGAGSLLVHIVKNPLIIGSLLGIIASLAGLRLPYFLAKPVEDIASLATPFALMVLGGSLSFKSLLRNWKAIGITAILKTMIMPLVAVLAACALGFSGIRYITVIAVFAAPLATSSQIMARNENADYHLAAEMVTATALLSVVTIFLLVYVSKILMLV